jgi:tetratricopeptide (TPR) repeat protein
MPGGDSGHYYPFLQSLIFHIRKFRVNSLPMASGGAHQLQNPDADKYFCQGLTLAKQGRWKEALAAYRESLRMNPNRAQTYLNIGFVYYEMGHDQEAQHAFDRASRLQAQPCVPAKNGS